MVRFARGSGVTAEPSPLRRTALTALLLLVLFGLTFGVAWLALSPGPILQGRSEVPQVVALDLADARERLQSRGMRVATRDEPAIGTERAGIVLRQDPVTGTAVPTGFTVQLAVSTGRALSTMPDVIGFPIELAMDVVRSAGLRIGGIDSVAGPADARGLILVTRPAAGTARTAGDAVDLVVSREP